MKIKAFLKRVAIVVLIIVGLGAARWGILSLIRDIPVCPFCIYSHVIHNYYLATGISEKCASDSPDDTIKIYGIPDSVESEALEGTTFTKVYYHYDGFSINFLTEDGVNFEHSGFTIYSDKIKIRHDIHIGSTRQQIMNAYSECQIYSEEEGAVYLDTGYRNALADCVRFEYDENDIVTKITFYCK